jgi:hypothetical protein
MSARRSAGALFTPSPVIATVRPSARRASTTRAARLTWRCSGLISGVTRYDNAAMRPSSVAMPVA